jgi:hypothetical protein
MEEEVRHAYYDHRMFQTKKLTDHMDLYSHWQLSSAPLWLCLEAYISSSSLSFTYIDLVGASRTIISGVLEAIG